MFLQKYDEAKAGGVLTHRVSDLFCGDADQSLRHDFEGWAHSGIMTIELRTWLTAYQLCCLDDSMQESPHGIITNLAKTRPNSSPKQWAALYRYQQNMAVKRSMEMNHPGRFCTLFKHWRLVFSRKPTMGVPRLLHPRNPIKARFLERVYRMNDYAFHNVGAMKKDQTEFLHSVTNAVKSIKLHGKICREYLRMVVLPSDIVSFIPVPSADMEGGISEAELAISALEPPELYSIVSSDQYRLKTIVTQSAHADLNVPAPFMVLYRIMDMYYLFTNCITPVDRQVLK